MTYPVRVFVEVAYRFLMCPDYNCNNGGLMLLTQVTNSQNENRRRSTNLYSGHNIQPNNYFNISECGIGQSFSGTKKIFFNVGANKNGFYLALNFIHGCVEISRIVVYVQQCAEIVVGLALYPRTLAPALGSVSVDSVCAENAHQSQLNTLSCTSEAKWKNNNQVVCECDAGYFRQYDKCEGEVGGVYHVYKHASFTIVVKMLLFCSTH